VFSILLFFWTSYIVYYSSTKPLCFGSWLCSHLQVKIPFLLGPIEGANPNAWKAEEKLLKPSIASKR
jgi:hypothetical protein